MSAWSDAVAALPAPYLWWKLDETTGTVAADSSGNSQAGTYASATLNQASLIPGDGTGKSITLSGTSSNVSKGSAMSFPGVGVTYALTIKTTTDITTGRLFQASGNFYLSLASTSVTAQLNTASVIIPYDPSGLADGAAHLVVYVVRATTVELWVDGSMVGSGAHAGTATTMTTYALKQNFSGPVGSYDDALIWSTALSSTQIANLYAGWTGAPPAAQATLGATLRSKTASIAAAITGSGTIAATLRPKAAAFTAATVLAASLAATTQPRSASIALDLPSGPDRTADLVASLRRKTAAFGVLSDATTTLSTTLHAKAATFTVEAVYAGPSPVTLVERVQVLVDDVDNPTNTVVDGSDGFALTETPQPGDVVVVTAPQYDGAVTSVSGLGGTWSEFKGGYNPLWMSTDAATSGALTLTMAEGSAVLATAYLRRGLTETPVSYAEAYQLDGGEAPSPELLAASGQFVIVTVHSGGRYPLTFPSATEPAAGWVPAPTTNTTRFGEAYRIPTESTAVPHRASSYRTSLDARDTAIFAVGPLPQLAAGLASTLRRKAASLSVLGAPIVAIAATLRPKGASASLYAPAVTETGRRDGGRTRDGLAVATWEPAVVAPPGVMLSSEHRRIRAQAFGPVTMNGPQPVYAVSDATAPRLRTRILVGGKDVSFLDDIPTPEPDWQLAEPLLWGTSAVELPSIPAAFFDPADHPWLAKGKPVVYQRVTSGGTKVGVDYRGVVIAHDISGKTLRLDVGGHASGRAAMRHKPLPIFRNTLDLGRLAWAAVRDLGLRFSPRLGPTTGIKQALFGGTDHLAHISELCAKAFDRDGQWSLMPDDGATYRFARKDTTTVHWTLYNDDTRVVADLRSDAAEEPNRVFASGVTPKGQRVRFGVYPGLKPGDPAPYPFADDRTFGLGTEDADTDTGDGITVMVRKMWTAGYLSLEDATGDYDQDVTRALMSLQEDAGLSTTGNMNPATWAALFDLDVTGYTLRGSRIEPAAQDYRVRRYNRSASGQFIELNPNFDRHRLIVDRAIDFGSGFTRHQMRDWSRSEVYRGEDNWVGTITITTGAILRGDIAPGTTIGEADLADVRDIRPGQNVRLPLFAGGILLHIAGVEITRTEGGHPIARLTVDTQARDAMPIWEIIRRNRETRRDAARRWTGNRASSQVKDSVTEWDEIGGVLYGDVNLRAGWNVIPVVAGQEGTVSRLRLVVQDVTGSGGDVAIAGREFACAVFGRAVTPKRLRTLIGNPLSGSPDATAEPDPTQIDPPTTDPEADGADTAPAATPSRPWWERKAIQDELRKLDLLYGAGTHEEPCGYDPGRKQAGATKTGMHRDDDGFSYRTRREPVLYLAVWVWGDRTLSGGRVMWPQLEAGA